MTEEVNEHYQVFHSSLKAKISSYENLSEDQIAPLQKDQIERLVALEKGFRNSLRQSKAGPAVYQEFVDFVRDTKKNILQARPYFRERQDVFSEFISVALENRDWEVLSRYHINYEFVRRVMEESKVEMSPQLRGSLRRQAMAIKKAREELVVMNLRLVIQRSNLFWRKTPKSHLSFMDLIQLGTLGLIAAVDKFVLPYSPVFCSVAIGRMVSNFIEWYSDTMLHFYPSDRRKLYRANKLRSKDPHNVLDFDELAAAVNRKDEDEEQKNLTNPEEIADLVAAASALSADVRVPGEPDVPSSVARYEAPEEARPDVQFEQAEAMQRMLEAASRLPLLDRKLLRLRGIPVDLTV